MTLFTAIVSMLCFSALADEQNTIGCYTIFEWDDGMRMQRDLIDGSFYCGFQKFLLIHMPDSIVSPSIVSPYVSSYTQPQERSHNMEIIKERIRERIAWLILKYIGNESISALNRNRLGLPTTLSELYAIAEAGAPDRVDPYELTIYQTGQMNKSMFMMNQDDFLKTIGRS